MDRFMRHAVGLLALLVVCGLTWAAKARKRGRPIRGTREDPSDGIRRIGRP